GRLRKPTCSSGTFRSVGFAPAPSRRHLINLEIECAHNFGHYRLLRRWTDMVRCHYLEDDTNCS
ncbi:MAG: hypothetical protein PHQ27_09720, partial [Victivallales bacterium]|nr:hypothetical protein [Victivallales bacterium]